MKPLSVPVGQQTSSELFDRLGVEVTQVGRDWVEMRLDPINRYGPERVPGFGLLLPFVDFAVNTSFVLRNKAFVPFVTLDLRLDYVRSVSFSAPLYAFAQCHEPCEDTALVNCTVHEGKVDVPLVRAVGTLFVLSK